MGRFTIPASRPYVILAGTSTMVRQGGPPGPPGSDAGVAAVIDEIETPGTPTRLAVEAAAGSVYDPATAALVGTASATRTALDGRFAQGTSVNARSLLATPTGSAGTDNALIQAHLNAAATSGATIEVRGQMLATGLLLNNNNTLQAANGGGQVSSAASRLTYAGAAGGTLIGPRFRTTDTINTSIRGLQLNGGGLAATVVDMYRTSYSRLEDLSIFGGQAGTGVGVLFDANVSNQCYFNTADNCKVDGLPFGVRFQNGANANRWEGGKIGNGGTAMEFLSIASGNYVAGTDMESSSVKHVYIDAPSNVFIGVHMEAAPLGFDVTANGSGWRHFGTTPAATVTVFINDLSLISNGMDPVDADTYLMQLGSLKILAKLLSGSTQVNVDPKPFSGTASILFNWFRNVTTSGARQFRLYKGDGTSTTSFLLDFGTNTLSIGEVGLGGLVGGMGIVNRTTAPATNPAGGGVGYAEGGALRWKTSSGTVSTVAGDVVSKSANYTAVAADRVILATGGVSGITITLPAATAGAQYLIKKVDAGAGAVTVATTSSQTIDGATTKLLAAQWASVRVVSDGTAWFVVG